MLNIGEFIKIFIFYSLIMVITCEKTSDVTHIITQLNKTIKTGIGT